MTNCLLYDINNNKIVIVTEDILDKLYYLEYRPIIQEDIKNNKDKDISKIISGFKDILYEQKQIISKQLDKIPLYDAYTENIYLINRENIYYRVMHQYYRFPEKFLLDELEQKKIKIENSNSSDLLILRKLNKLSMMIKFMNYFDLDTLYSTYVQLYYKYSDKAGKELTICKNPSFTQYFFHIKPYLSRTEVINTALNMEMDIKKLLENDNINEICQRIKKYQITSQTLLEHQKYIQDSGNMGLVQYYTLQGSFFMNQYLRNKTSYTYKNIYLEKLITPMWNMVLNSPAFDNEYILYRFVQNDLYIRHIKIGEIFTEDGFMSTTRDPYYKSDVYKFGFILIKIKIPAGKKGVALCLETVSHFPDEQEIIFPPKTQFKLVKRDTDCIYYHTNQQFSSKVKTRYELEWVTNSPVRFDRTNDNVKINNVDFIQIKSANGISLIENIKYFQTNYTNDLFQFKTKIGTDEFTIMTEWFDSTSAYKNYYAIETKDGYSIYTLYRGFILFFIELGETENGKQMHVNYYAKYSSIDPEKIVGDENLIYFFSSIANYFKIANVVLYANYLNCDTTVVLEEQNGGFKRKKYKSGGYKIQRGFESKHIKYNTKTELNMMGGSYCKDLFMYLQNNKKRYVDLNILNAELKPKFSYYDLDILNKTSASKILKKEDVDELYQVYNKSYILKNKNNDSIGNFYIWLKENKGYLLDIYVAKIDRIMGKNNPFRNDMYILNPMTYLYNRNYINTYPTYGDISFNIKRNILKQNYMTDRIDMDSENI